MTRATWLGSAGVTVLIRCACGARLYLSRGHWQRRGFTACDDCKSLIRYGSLDVVDPHDAEDFISMIVTQEEEKEALRADLELELRRFVRAFDQQPEWLWSPATRRFVRTVRPKLEVLGGPIGQGRGAGDYGVAQEAAYTQEEDADLLDEDEPDVPESDAA